jgi:endonuclease/exonuclease/phosphatase family metal-dependent hydrolase
MRVLTYNIWNYSARWRRRKNALVEAIRNASPDIVALQEVRHTWHDPPGNNQAKWLGRKLGMEWWYRPANVFVPFPPVTEGLGFLAAMKPSRLLWHPVPHTGRGPRRIVLEAELGGLTIYNVHYPLNPRDRIGESEVLLRVLAASENVPALIVGDFNDEEGTAPLSMLAEAGFVDTWLALPAACRPLVWPQSRRIDFVLARNAALEGARVEIVGATAASNGLIPSDHVGVLVDLPSIPESSGSSGSYFARQLRRLV